MTELIYFIAVEDTEFKRKVDHFMEFGTTLMKKLILSINPYSCRIYGF